MVGADAVSCLSPLRLPCCLPPGLRQLQESTQRRESKKPAVRRALREALEAEEPASGGASMGEHERQAIEPAAVGLDEVTPLRPPLEDVAELE